MASRVMTTKLASCRECHQEVGEGDLRDHWLDEHPERLKEIDKWLGKAEDKAREWERVIKRQEHGEHE